MTFKSATRSAVRSKGAPLVTSAFQASWSLATSNCPSPPRNERLNVPEEIGKFSIDILLQSLASKIVADYGLLPYTRAVSRTAPRRSTIDPDLKQIRLHAAWANDSFLRRRVVDHEQGKG